MVSRNSGAADASRSRNREDGSLVRSTSSHSRGRETWLSILSISTKLSKKQKLRRVGTANAA
jgi:hypothetical protein